MPPTAADLAAWQALADAVSPGPWTVAEHQTGHKAILAPYQTGEHGSVAKVFCDIDAAFIAASRAAVPSLLAEVERLHDLIRRAYAGDPDDLYAEGERLTKGTNDA